MEYAKAGRTDAIFRRSHRTIEVTLVVDEQLLRVLPQGRILDDDDQLLEARATLEAGLAQTRAFPMANGHTLAATGLFCRLSTSYPRRSGSKSSPSGQTSRKAERSPLIAIR